MLSSLPHASSVPYQLRPAVPADAASIVGLIRELADFEQLLHLVEVTPETLAPQLFGPRPGAQALVAESGATVVGFALYFHNFSTFLGRPGLYLEDLYVQPAHRGRGIGAALLTRLAALAVERGCGRFEWSVLDWNASAIGFYSGMGATVMPEWRICRVAGDALTRLAARRQPPVDPTADAAAGASAAAGVSADPDVAARAGDSAASRAGDSADPRGGASADSRGGTSPDPRAGA